MAERLLTLAEQDVVRAIYAQVRPHFEGLSKEAADVILTALRNEFGNPRGLGGWVARGKMEVVDAEPPPDAQDNGC